MLFTGTMIAPGIALGPATVWAPASEPVLRRQVPAADVPGERERLQHALDGARRELEEVALRVAHGVGPSAAAVFTAHKLLLDDPVFFGAIASRIEGERLAAESAVQAATEDQRRRFAALGNGYFAARAEDLVELGRRLLRHLRKEMPREMPRFFGRRVLIAESLAAAEVIALDRDRLLGLVLVQGAAASHAALLASTLGVPVVGGVSRLTGQVHEGETVIVDGNHGHVLVNPTELAVRQYHTRREIFDRFCGELAGLRDVPAVTPDGRRVRLEANIGLLEEAPRALSQGAEGVGLLRTEYFYLAQHEPPGEEAQFQFYLGVVRALAPRRVTFRTLDLGGDKVRGAAAGPEVNPMLGCRGIRLQLEQRDLFTSQMRALLRVSRYGPVRIMFPLITSLTEFQDTLALVEQVRRQLRREEILFDEKVPFGCMIETPAAATIPDLLASEVEFFSIGSNDLIQYTLAVDRTDPRVAYIYEPLHLAVLRMMQSIIEAARRQGRPVSLCGEMAADPIYTIILLGLGVDELSMNPVMIPAIKQIIRGVTWAEARQVARGVLQQRRAKDVQSYLERMTATRFPQVMSIYGHATEDAAIPAERSPNGDGPEALARPDPHGEDAS